MGSPHGCTQSMGGAAPPAVSASVVEPLSSDGLLH